MNLAYGASKTQSARIQTEINLKDITVSFTDKNVLEVDDIFDPITNEKVEGYIFKDNTKVKLSMVNLFALKKPFFINNYYYKKKDEYDLKITNYQNYHVSSTDYYVIPQHTYEVLKNNNELSDKVFVLECHYEVYNQNLAETIPKMGTISEAMKNTFYVDEYGNYIEKKVKKIYFKLLDEKDFDERYEVFQKKLAAVVHDKKNVNK